MGCGVYDDASHSNGRTRSHASDAMTRPLLAFVFIYLDNIVWIVDTRNSMYIDRLEDRRKV